MAIVQRERKSEFIRLFTKTPSEVLCPHFYELILSNGCPYDCAYCYLKLTFRGKTAPVVFCNRWQEVEEELEKSGPGVYSTGELADSLAVVPPLLEPAMDYFSHQKDKYLLLLTKSTNIEPLLNREPSSQIIVSFSVNSIIAWKKYEKGTPGPLARLKVAKELKKLGWRIRIRIDPIILDVGLESYKSICERVAALKPERVTVGSLRQYPGLRNFAKDAPTKMLNKASDGRMRYPLALRMEVYSQIAEWLGFQPALCKETKELWNMLGWNFYGCNCTP